MASLLQSLMSPGAREILGMAPPSSDGSSIETGLDPVLQRIKLKLAQARGEAAPPVAPPFVQRDATEVNPQTTNPARYGRMPLRSGITMPDDTPPEPEPVDPSAVDSALRRMVAPRQSYLGLQEQPNANPGDPFPDAVGVKATRKPVAAEWQALHPGQPFSGGLDPVMLAAKARRFNDAQQVVQGQALLNKAELPKVDSGMTGDELAAGQGHAAWQDKQAASLAARQALVTKAAQDRRLAREFRQDGIGPTILGQLKGGGGNNPLAQIIAAQAAGGPQAAGLLANLLAEDKAHGNAIIRERIRNEGLTEKGRIQGEIEAGREKRAQDRMVDPDLVQDVDLHLRKGVLSPQAREKLWTVEPPRLGLGVRPNWTRGASGPYRDAWIKAVTTRYPAYAGKEDELRKFYNDKYELDD